MAADDPYVGPHIPPGVTPEPGGRYPSDPQDDRYEPPEKYDDIDDPGCCSGADGIMFMKYRVTASVGDWGQWFGTDGWTFDPHYYDHYSEACTPYHHGWIRKHVTVTDSAEVQYDGAAARTRYITHDEYINSCCFIDKSVPVGSPPQCSGDDVLKFHPTTTSVSTKSWSAQTWLLCDLMDNINGHWEGFAYRSKTTDYKVRFGWEDGGSVDCYASYIITSTITETIGYCAPCDDPDVPFPPMRPGLSYGSPVGQHELSEHSCYCGYWEHAYINCVDMYRCVTRPNYCWDDGSSGGGGGGGWIPDVDPGIPDIPPDPPGKRPPPACPDCDPVIPPGKPGEPMDCITAGGCQLDVMVELIPQILADIIPVGYNEDFNTIDESELIDGGKVTEPEEVQDPLTGRCTTLTEECIYPDENEE